MDDSSDSSATVFQTLAGAFSGGLSAYYDAQNTAPVYVTQPTPQTAYGYAGTGQYTPASGAGISPMLLLVGIAVVAVLILKK